MLDERPTRSDLLAERLGCSNSPADRTCQPIDRASRSASTWFHTFQISWSMLLTKWCSIEYATRLVNITLRIMRYYASTLNHFYNSFVVWNASRSNSLFDRATSCWEPLQKLPADRLSRPIERTVRPIDLKGKDTSVFSNTTTKTSKVQTIIHKHIQLKGRNNPLEQSSRSSLPADRTGLSNRTYQPTEQPVRSNLPFNRPVYSIHSHLSVFPRYSLLCYRTIQANPTLSAPFNP